MTHTSMTSSSKPGHVTMEPRGTKGTSLKYIAKYSGTYMSSCGITFTLALGTNHNILTLPQ